MLYTLDQWQVLFIIVCGADTTKQKKQAMTEITYLKDLYNKTKDNEQITKVCTYNVFHKYNLYFTQLNYTILQTEKVKI